MAAIARSTQRDPDGPGEFSWGPGLTSPGLSDALPADGGRYRGKSPATADPPGWRALADELADRVALNDSAGSEG